MTFAPDYEVYAQMMRRLAGSGTDLEVDARFVDMLSPRNSRILDLGCGIGSAVNGLRRRGHEAYGLDPTEAVLRVARELFEAEWYRHGTIEGVSRHALQREGWPDRFEVILLAGNVPAFLSPDGLRGAFLSASELLVPGGFLVVGTTTAVRGGPGDQDQAARRVGLVPIGRFSDWHLGRFTEEAAWSVSVYASPGELPAEDGPGGIFVLPG